MSQQPAVIIIARHGPRLDAADRNWHLSTPTPYDPPLTYGGWKNSTTLGIRIASLLYAREQSLSTQVTTTEPPTPEGVKSHDFAAQQNGDSTQNRKRKRRTHKIVIHTSPFLRCVQTSVAIAAGISQFAGPSTNGSGSRSSASSRARTPNHFSSVSARSSVSDHSVATGLLSIPESRHGLAQEVTRRVHESRHKRVNLRVDAFLGEWLNPEYFEDITPPPPSAMMVATAKAELMQNDTIDVFTPSITHKSSRSSLWGGASTGTRPQSRDSALEDWDDINDALPPPSPRRDRTSSYSSVASSDSAGSRISRSGLGPQSFLRAEATAYAPPVPTYAISTSDRIPKGYVAHAKNNCTNIDFHWDSSRPPQDWGDGGEYGEEWSLMQRRFRKGLTQLVHWYSRHNADDRGEDALGLDQAEHHDDDLEEQEDLVVILVSHSAGCNALIGALTGQPVLLDVGTASLTMGVRKDDAPIPSEYATDFATYANDNGRRGSLDIGLTSSYDLKVIASTEHLRPGYDPFRFLAPIPRPIDNLSRLRPFRGDSMPTVTLNTPWDDDEHAGRGSTSTALGSILRPHSSSHASNGTTDSSAVGPEIRERTNTRPLPDSDVTSPTLFTGLWTPPSARTPQLQAKYIKDERREIFSSLNEGIVSRPSSAVPESGTLVKPILHRPERRHAATDGRTDSDKQQALEELKSQLSNKTSPPSKGQGHRVLWAASIEDHPVRGPREGTKRRWTMSAED